MKNTVSILILSMVTGLVACNKSEKNDEKKELKNSSVNVRIDSVKIHDSIKTTGKPTLVFNSKMLVFPDLKDQSLLDSIYYYPGKSQISDYSVKAIQAIMEKDKKDYFEGFKKNKNAPQNENIIWYDNFEMSVKSVVNDYLQIEIFNQSGEKKPKDPYQITDKVIDLKNNKKLQLSDITSIDKNKLSGILKSNFEKTTAMLEMKKKNANLYNQAVKQSIPVSKNFYFDTEKLYFQYNINEINDFWGNVIISVPFEELKDTMNPEFKERMKIK